MSAPRIIPASLPSFYPKLSKLVEIWRSSDKNNLAQFFRDTVYTALSVLCGWQTSDKSWPTLSADNVGRQKSVVCHGKVGQLLLADKSWPTTKVFQHVRKPSDLSSGILDCDWWATLFTNMEGDWKDEDCFKLISLYELNSVLYDPSDRNYRNRELKRQKESEIATALEKPGKKRTYSHIRLYSRT